MKSYPGNYEGAPDYDEDPDWMLDLSTELAEEIPAPHWCTDLDAIASYSPTSMETGNDMTTRPSLAFVTSRIGC